MDTLTNICYNDKSISEILIFLNNDINELKLYVMCKNIL